MKKSGYLNAIQKTMFLLEKEEFFSMNCSKEIEYTSYNGVVSTIPQAFLLKLLDDEGYKYFNRMVDNKQGTLKFTFLIGDSLGPGIRITAVDAISCLRRMALSDVQKRKLMNLGRKCTLNGLLNSTKEEYYSVTIDDKDFVLNVNSMLNVFLLDKETFCQLFKHKTILGIDKRYFAYALNKYLYERDILQRYFFPPTVVKRFNDLREQKLIDFESLSFLENDYMHRYNVELNPQLKEKIYNGMRETYSDLEKSIYIYIKMCKLFSYDPEYYVSGQRGYSSEIHSNVNRITSIHDSDDAIVCYEFNAIFGKFLDDLNIKYRINTKRVHGRYGKGHANLTYSIDKYIIFADAVTSILGGDLINAKINANLNGLKCENMSEETKKEFSKVVEKVYSDILKDEKNNHRFFESLKEYNEVIKENELISFKEKIQLIVDLTNSSNMKLVDTLGYMMKLKKLFFKDEELKNNVSISIIRTMVKNTPKLGVIISIKEKNTNNYKYFYYLPDRKMVVVPKLVLKSLIDKGIIEQIEGTNRFIPGIGEVKRR